MNAPTVRFDVTVETIGEQGSPLHWIVQTIAMWHSGILIFSDKNYLHELKKYGRLVNKSAVCCFNGFTQCHACVVQTTTRYAGVHKKLYKKITNRITIRMFKSIVKKKGDFNGK